MGFDNIKQIPPNYHEGDNKLRLLPSVFAELRAKLQEESSLKGGLLLAEAREALRIDVNKTRRVFDLLVAEGVIQVRSQ